MDNPFFPHLLVEDRDGVKVVVLNRPENFNAVDTELHGALAGIWRHLAGDQTARAVVLTGAGSAFSAGGDMPMLQRLREDVAQRRIMIEEARQIIREMLEFPLPVVAAVNGPAVGLGCSLALLCDIVYISHTAYLADPHVAVGLTAGDGGAATWPLLTSILRAKEYLFTGERIPAATAVTLGLANRCIDADQLMPEALALGERLAALPPQAVRTTKRALNIHLLRAAEGVLEYALAAEHDSFSTPEHRAIVDGFLTRR